nr:hypothetical protein [Candidatus Sigynarchaeota archaeon]
MRLISLVQPAYPVPAHSPDMFHEPLPRMYVLDGSSHGDPLGSWIVALIINWSGRNAELECGLHELGCQDATSYHVIDFWENQYLGTLSSDDSLTFKKVPSHGSKLVRLVKDEGKDVVQFLGSTLHVLQGAVEIARFQFNNEKGVLAIKISKDGQNSGKLFIKLPLRLLPAEQDGTGYHLSDVAENVYQIDVTFEDELDINLKIQQA